MRFVFKTTYDQDIRLFRHGGQVFWYGLLALALLVAPTLLPSITCRSSRSSASTASLASD